MAVQSARPASNSDSSSSSGPTSVPASVTRQTSLQSPGGSSSSTSIESSRPPSRGSSHSSPPPPELSAKGALSDIELSTLSGADENGDETSREGSRHGSGSTITASAPTNAQDASSTPQSTPAPRAHGESVLSRMQRWMSRRQWFGNSIGLLTLVLTLVTLTTIGTHSYELDKLNEYMAYLQVCLSKKQINATLDAGCQAAIALPVPKPPHKLITRAYNSTGFFLKGMTGRRDIPEDQNTRWQRAMAQINGFLQAQRIHIWGNMYDDLLHVVIALTAMLAVVLPFVLGAMVLMKHLRQTSRVEEVFSSPARNEVEILRHHADGPHRMKGVRMIRHKPEEQHFLGQLRHNIRRVLERDPAEQEAIAETKRRSPSPEEGNGDGNPPQDWVWKDHLDVTSILESPWSTNGNSRRPSNVTIRGKVDGEDHQQEGLIELKTKGSNKTFFDPATGEFIRLTPWKAGAVADEDDDKVKGDEKGNTKKALARMGTGAVAFAGGKSVDELIIEELDREGILSAYNRIPQKMGDSLAGEVTNQ